MGSLQGSETAEVWDVIGFPADYPAKVCDWSISHPRAIGLLRAVSTIYGIAG